MVKWFASSAPERTPICLASKFSEPSRGLGLFFGMEPRFWLNLQAEYEQATPIEHHRRAQGGRAGLEVERPDSTRKQAAAPAICRNHLREIHK